LNFKAFGDSGRKVSEIGMGTYYDPLWIALARGFGWRRGRGSKVEALKAGLEGGMNLIDTAELYGSEGMVAEAVKGRRREDLFIATKVWPNHLRRDALVRALEKSLARLGTSYVDLYLVHFPNSSVPIAETMAAMEEMKDKGRLVSVGVSNFSMEQTKEANEALKRSQLACNEAQYSLRRRQIEDDLLPYCESNGISILAYYPLGHGKLARGGQASGLEVASKACSKTPAQVALNWLVSKRNVFAIPRASRAEHVKENLGGSGWEMNPEDRAKLEAAFPR
jgi:diketogulonate reductase-like aldo/keto reductase